MPPFQETRGLRRQKLLSEIHKSGKVPNLSGRALLPEVKIFTELTFLK